MTSLISSTSDANVIVALNLATNALATARQCAMPGAAEAAGALIHRAFEGGVSADIDERLAVDIAYARGAAAWIVTEGIGVPWGPELHRRCDRLATVLDEIRAGFRPATATSGIDIGRKRTKIPCDPPPDGLRTPAEAARKLRCSIKTLNGHVASGALGYVIIGHGKKRPRKMFADADLDAFIATQTRKHSLCPSTATRAPRSGNTTSRGEVIAFSAQPKPRPGAKPKK